MERAEIYLSAQIYLSAGRGELRALPLSSRCAPFLFSYHYSMQSEAGLKFEWFKVRQKEVISSYFDAAYRQLTEKAQTAPGWAVLGLLQLRLIINSCSDFSLVSCHRGAKAVWQPSQTPQPAWQVTKLSDRRSIH